MLARLHDALKRSSFGARERTKFFEQMALLLDNGVSLQDTLQSLHNTASDGGRKPTAVRAQIFSELMAQVSSGRSFARAMTPWATPQEVSLIAAGEASGKLLDAFKRITLMLDKRTALIGAITGALVYPLVLILGAIGMYLFVAYSLAPPLLRVMPLNAWPGATHTLLTAALFLKANILTLAVVTALLIALIIYSLPRLGGRLRDVLDRIPPWSVYRLFQGSGFLLNIATMLASGIALDDAMQRLLAHAMPYLRERIDHTLRGIRSGKNFGEALYLAEHDFPDKGTIQSLRTLSGRSGFDTALEKYTLRWLDENLAAIKSAAAWLRIVAFALVSYALYVYAAGTYGIAGAVQH